MENRIRTRYLSNDERTIIEEKAKKLGITVGEYIAYMAINGYVIHYDFIIDYINALKSVEKQIYSLCNSILSSEDYNSSDIEELIFEINKINSSSNNLMRLILDKTQKIIRTESMKGNASNEHKNRISHQG